MEEIYCEANSFFTEECLGLACDRLDVSHNQQKGTGQLKRSPALDNIHQYLQNHLYSEESLKSDSQVLTLNTDISEDCMFRPSACNIHIQQSSEELSDRFLTSETLDLSCLEIDLNQCLRSQSSVSQESAEVAQARQDNTISFKEEMALYNLKKLMKTHFIELSNQQCPYDSTNESRFKTRRPQQIDLQFVNQH